MTTRKYNKHQASWLEERMHRALEHRRQRGTLRCLSQQEQEETPNTRTGSTRSSNEDDDAVMDFSSNDYIGLAHDREQAILCHDRLSQALKQLQLSSSSSSSARQPFLGATGSRLLSGDSPAFLKLEEYLARLHHRPAALLCNSGYDANLSVVSSLPCQVIVHDEHVHNSLHMGMRLWKSSSSSSSSDSQQQESLSIANNSDNSNDEQVVVKRTVSFRHNDTADLERQLQNLVRSQSKDDDDNNNDRIVVLIESVYSMDGDVSPVKEMLDVCYKYGALLVVDEAHGLGTFGRRKNNNKSLPVMEQLSVEWPWLPGTGVLAEAEVEDHPALLCSIHTFGKAAGCHGAVVCGSLTLKAYLVNYGYPFIYSTALPTHSLVTIRCAYETMTGPKGEELRIRVFGLVRFFQDRFHSQISKYTDATTSGVYLLPSTSPIQALMIPGNLRCADFCRLLYQKSNRRILLYPIKTPTVPAGQERVRIIIHAHNTIEQVETLLNLIQGTLEDMELLLLGSSCKGEKGCSSSLLVQRSRL